MTLTFWKGMSYSWSAPEKSLWKSFPWGFNWRSWPRTIPVSFTLQPNGAKRFILELAVQCRYVAFMELQSFEDVVQHLKWCWSAACITFPSFLFHSFFSEVELDSIVAQSIFNVMVANIWYSFCQSMWQRGAWAFVPSYNCGAHRSVSVVVCTPIRRPFFGSRPGG